MSESEFRQCFVFRIKIGTRTRTRTRTRKKLVFSPTPSAMFSCDDVPAVAVDWLDMPSLFRVFCRVRVRVRVRSSDRVSSSALRKDSHAARFARLILMTREMLF